jgi:hypothetical protein
LHEQPERFNDLKSLKFTVVSLVVAVISILTAGCGGGGGSSADTTPPDIKYIGVIGHAPWEKPGGNITVYSEISDASGIASAHIYVIDDATNTKNDIVAMVKKLGDAYEAKTYIAARSSATTIYRFYVSVTDGAGNTKDQMIGELTL